MRKCAIRNMCPFYRDQVPKAKRSIEDRKELRHTYCSVGSTQCARYLVFQTLGLDEVPVTLFPDELFKVNVLLNFP